MKMKKVSLLIIPVVIAVTSLFMLSAFKTAPQSYKVSCQFSPTTSSFSNVEMENCNNLATNASVAAGTSWSPSLIAANCSSVYITTGLPASHPAGTIKVYKNGVLVAAHTVAQDQPASYFDVFSATLSDRFLVTW